VLTGYSSIATAVKAIQLGAVDYLVKPYSMNDLLLRVNHTLSDLQSKNSIA